MAFEMVIYSTCRGYVELSRTLLKAAFCLGIIVFTAEAKAQGCGAQAASAIATDRPQITNSSVVVPCGSVQVENGFQVTGVRGEHVTDFPETALRFGVAARTEMRLSVPNYSHNGSSNSGFGDLSLGMKQQLGPIRGFDLSLIPSLSLPTGAKGFSSGGYDPAVQAPWSRGLSKSWTVAGQLGVAWPTVEGRRNAAGQGSVYFDRQLSSAVDAYVEYAGVFSQRGGPQHLIDFGTAYKPTPHQQLDLHCGFGLSSAAPDYAVGFGYSFRFQVIR